MAKCPSSVKTKKRSHEDHSPIKIPVFLRAYSLPTSPIKVVDQN